MRAAGIIAVILGAASGSVASASGDATTVAIAAAIGNVSAAQGIVFNARTAEGNLDLDALKIIQGPVAGGYIGVYDTLGPNDYFVTRVSTSTNLRDWNPGAILSTHASTPDIYQVHGAGYLVAMESSAANGDSSLEVQFFPSYGALIAGHMTADVILRRHLSPRNEGTPTIEAATMHHGPYDSQITIGFHFNSGSGIDRNGVGTLVDFSHWSERPNIILNHAIEARDVTGSIGARDFATIDGTTAEIVEAETTPHDWATWRLYTFDPKSGAVSPLELKTPRGDHLSAGIARVTVVRDARHQKVLVSTAFVYSEGSSAGTAGELIWWRRL